MAKQGQIAVIGTPTNAELAQSVAMSEAPVMSLGQLAAAILASSPVRRALMIDTAARTVWVFPTPSSSVIGNDVEDGAAVTIRLTKDDDTKKSSPWTSALVTPAAPGAVALDALVDPVKPTRSLATMIAAIEDEPEAASITKLIIVDQVAGTLRVWTDSVTNAMDQAEGAYGMPVAVIRSVLTEETGAPAFEFE